MQLKANVVETCTFLPCEIQTKIRYCTTKTSIFIIKIGIIAF